MLFADLLGKRRGCGSDNMQVNRGLSAGRNQKGGMRDRSDLLSLTGGCAAACDAVIGRSMRRGRFLSLLTYEYGRSFGDVSLISQQFEVR